MPKGGFNVTQSNGPHVGFGNLKVGPDGTTTGEASFISNDGPVTGTVTGTIIGAHVDLTVHWKNNNAEKRSFSLETSVLTATFPARTKPQMAPRRPSRVKSPGLNARSTIFVEKMPDDAITAETEFASLHCGTVGSGRWSDKIDDHITWYMVRTRAGGSPIQSETDERAQKNSIPAANLTRGARNGLGDGCRQ